MEEEFQCQGYTEHFFFFLTMLSGSEDHEIFTLLFGIHAS